ncbi:hypothetical protein B296_00033791 [Ensete ventricosum]|uniref:Plant heme peroxidase family profile domain-containing protein n=1 Tax=Ensete ventricosum TaxID=4639 RepID=A0A427A8T4_ENSVE|nr:hypothetical protein B296_00033791 [Ensete ventricosum]
MATAQMFFTIFFVVMLQAQGQLTPDFYDAVCPQALPTIRTVVEAAVALQPRLGASLVRMHFHDCFVNLGGGSYEVLLGRRDATTASKDDANADIPTPFSGLPDLLAKFQSHGLAVEDLVVLSGAHTLGYARCALFRDRLYNETSTIDSDFASALQAQCPRTGGDDELSPLDETSPAVFDVGYYRGLLQNKGLLHSDQQLLGGDGSGDTDALVQHYSENPGEFMADFGAAMIKLGSISPLTGSDGEIRENCRVANA